MAPISLRSLVTIYPVYRCRSSTIATIIQHSAENLREITCHRSHITPGANGLSAPPSQLSLLGKGLTLSSHFVRNLQNIPRKILILDNGGDLLPDILRVDHNH